MISLDISKNNLGVAGAIVLCDIKDGFSIEDINLRDNNFGDQGAIEFSRLFMDNHNVFKEIDLSFNKI